MTLIQLNQGEAGPQSLDHPLLLTLLCGPWGTFTIPMSNESDYNNLSLDRHTYESEW